MDSENIGFEVGNEGSLDLSEAGLEARGWEEAGGNDPAEIPAVEDTPVVDPSDDVEDPEESTEDATDEDAEEASEVDDTDPEDEFEVPDKLKGKTAEELAKMFADLESHTAGRQTNEIGDLRTIVEQQNAQLELLRDHLARQSSSEISDDLSELARANPQGIYQQALAALDNGQVGIDVVEDVIEEVYGIAEELNEEGDHNAARQYNRIARSMQRDFDRRLTIAQAQATQAPLQQQAQKVAYEKGIQQYFTASEEGAREDAKTYQQEVQNLLKGKDLGSTAEEVANNLNQALIYVRGLNPTRSAAFKQQQAKLKGNAQGERGNTDPPPKVPTEEERIRSTVFNSKDPAKDIFANFAVGPA